LKKKIKYDKYRDDWLRFIVHKLVYGCNISSDIFRNDVHFVTFNYDTSVEFNLLRSLASIDLISTNDAVKFLTEDRISHIYGAVHTNIPKEDEVIDLQTSERLGLEPQSQGETVRQTRLIDYCYEAAKNLKTIDPIDKGDNLSSLERANCWMTEAELVYILGYGFDISNNRRIGLDQIKQDKQVVFTNFDNLNTINKTAGHLFCNSYRHFIRDEFISGHAGQKYYVEKSIRTVYEALEKDFYALETGDLLA
jgi:hypothetical protein